MELRSKIFYYLKAQSGKKFKYIMTAIDQASHFTWGAGIAGTAFLFGMDSQVGLIALPVLAILPREMIDQWPIQDIPKTVTDILVFGLGGAAVLTLTNFL